MQGSKVHEWKITDHNWGWKTQDYHNIYWQLCMGLQYMVVIKFLKFCDVCLPPVTRLWNNILHSREALP